MKIKFSLITVSFLCILLLNGCGGIWAGYTAKEKATINVELFSSWYVDTYATAKNLIENGTADEKELMKKYVTPQLNKLKPLIIKHNNLVKLWNETNEKPDTLEELATEIQRVVLKIIEIMGSKGGV